MPPLCSVGAESLPSGVREGEEGPAFQRHSTWGHTHTQHAPAHTSSLQPAALEDHHSPEMRTRDSVHHVFIALGLNTQNHPC